MGRMGNGVSIRLGRGCACVLILLLEEGGRDEGGGELAF